MHHAVRAEGLRKTYGEVLALDGVDLVVEPGTVHGLVGPNGAGKTTVLSLLLGLTGADAGTLEVLGRPLPATGRRTPEGVAGCVEMPRFYPHLSARRNLRLLTRLDRHPASRAEVDAVLERVGLDSVPDAKVAGYSLGMRQRLGLASALLREHRLLVLDEPVNGLDPAGMADVRRLVRELADAGVAVLMSSHHMGELEAVCDAVTVMRAGRVVFAGTAEDLRERAPAAPTWLRTSDDVRALDLAVALGLGALRRDGGLVVRASTATLDDFWLRLAGRGVTAREVRSLATPLEALYAELTGTGEPGHPGTRAATAAEQVPA